MAQIDGELQGRLGMAAGCRRIAALNKANAAFWDRRMVADQARLYR
jgi:hypothetical protein